MAGICSRVASLLSRVVSSCPICCCRNDGGGGKKRKTEQNSRPPTDGHTVRNDSTSVASGVGTVVPTIQDNGGVATALATAAANASDVPSEMDTAELSVYIHSYQH